MSNIIKNEGDIQAPAGSTVPRIGDRPKRGIKKIQLKIINAQAKFRPHHQKTLLIELLEFKQGEATVLDLVDLIESNPAFWSRLNTVQSPYNCVVYHAKQLADIGYLSYEEIAAPGQTKERSAKNNQQLEVIEYAKRKVMKEEPKPVETIEEVTAELNITNERIKEQA